MTSLKKSISCFRLFIKSRACAILFVLPAPLTLGAAEEPDATITAAGLVSPHILALTIDEGAVQHGSLQPYQAQSGDTTKEAGPNIWVMRQGQAIGRLAGPRQEDYVSMDSYSGKRVNRQAMSDPSNYQLVDESTGQSHIPTAVYYKSIQNKVARVDAWDFAYGFQHIIYLVFPDGISLLGSQHLEISVYGLPHDYAFTIDMRTTLSPAIHVNQNGFRPDSLSKVAYLSQWMGDGGPVSYTDSRTFYLMDTQSGTPAYKGDIVLRRAKDEADDDRPLPRYPEGTFNYSKTDVYEMDFSSFSQVGEYRIVVPGIGVSYPFTIGPDVWRDPLYKSLKALYFHRSGIPLTKPYTDNAPFQRPLAFAPGNGTVVHGTDVSLYEHRNGLGKKGFEELVEGKTNETFDFAGGYMDAADWDRRIQHVEVSYLLLDLYEQFPDFYSSYNLNIPESNNSLPDVIDEALFNIDFYRRMQGEDGSIRGGIESAEHPRSGDTSWLESLEVFVYAPDAWSAYWYVIGAAKAAHVLKPLDAALSDQYRSSALKAMSWADDELTQDPKKYEKGKVDPTRAWANAELYRLTGEERFAKAFKSLLPAAQGSEDKYYQYLPAVVCYLEATPTSDDDAFRQALEKRYLDIMMNKFVIGSGEKSDFGYVKYSGFPPGWGRGNVTRDALPLLHAYLISGNPRYLEAAQRSADVSLGANPTNLSYTSDVGDNPVKNVMHVDTNRLDMPPPPGITVFGPIKLPKGLPGYIASSMKASGEIYPAPASWPDLEFYVRSGNIPPMNEYTVHNTLGPVAYLWGFLAAVEVQPSIEKQ